MNKSYLAIAVASLLSYTSFSQAQSVSSDDMDTIVVLGKSENINSISDIPANIVVIDQEEIKASGATSLSSLLRSRAGIQISDTNSGSAIAMRGFSGSQAAHNTLILVDGRKLNKLDMSAPQLSSILVSQIEKIEILSGSAGVLYGDQAVGGVINIITKRSTEPHGEVTASVGSYDSYAGSVNVSNRISDNWSFSLTASQDNSDNYRDHNDRETGNLLGRLDFTDGDKEFYTEASYYDNYRNYAGSLTDSLYHADPKQARNTTDYGHEITSALRLGYSQKILGHWLADAEISFSDTSADSMTTSYASDGTPYPPYISNIDYDQLEVQLGLERALVTTVGKGNLLLGTEYRSSDYTASSGRKDEQKIVSLYSQINYPIYKGVTIVTGGRYSKVEDDIKDLSQYPNGESLDEDANALELGVNFKPNQNTRLYLRGESNFRFADVDEQAYTPSDVHGLKAQKGISVEAGLDYVAAEYSVKIDIYNLKLKDEIVLDPVVYRNVNADESERFGGILYVDKYITDDIQVGAEYTYIDAEFTEGSNKGKELSWVAKHTGRGFVSYQFITDWRLFVEGVYVGDKYKDGDNSNSQEKLDGYWLGNLALNYAKNAFSANIRVDNAFDKDYLDSANSYGAYYPGSGRELKLTASYQF